MSTVSHHQPTSNLVPEAMPLLLPGDMCYVAPVPGEGEEEAYGILG